MALEEEKKIEEIGTKLDEKTLKKYEATGYKIVGKNKHTGVEVCRWTKSVLRGKKHCYKTIYGIKSHRCVQMTPTIDFCSFSCTFCWRRFGPERFKAHRKWDSPKEIVDGIIEAQRKLISGFGGNPLTKKEVFEEANDPVHVAISLDGEPTFYPYIVELIQEIKARGMTAFLVTNGTAPHKLREMIEKGIEPTNIYLSLYATNPQDYVKVTNSFIKDPWSKVMESLELLKEFKEARTIIRLTLVKGLNMKDPEGYAKLAMKANPWFIELKGYSWLGASTKRLTIDAMPKMHELEEFAEVIAKETGYIVKAKDKVSRVIALVRDEATWKRSLELIKKQDEEIAKKHKMILGNKN